MKREFFRKIKWSLLVCLLSLGTAYAQVDTTKVIVDDIQVDLKEVTVDKEKKAVEVALYLISYEKNPREFRLNTFASQVIDDKGKGYMFSTMQLDRVMVQAETRQNYLDYLLKHNKPVELRINYTSLSEDANPAYLKLVFQESSKEGKFLEVEIPLSEEEGQERE